MSKEGPIVHLFVDDYDEVVVNQKLILLIKDGDTELFKVVRVHTPSTDEGYSYSVSVGNVTTEHLTPDNALRTLAIELNKRNGELLDQLNALQQPN